MLKTDYNIPIFEDTDAADLNKYSNEMANALKTQINNTNNEIKEIDKKVVDAVDKFTEPLSYKGQLSTIQDLPISATNGDIYNVTSENKNYIYNGTNWVEYSSTLDLTYLENNTKTTQTTEVSEELTIENCAGVKGKLDIKSGKSEQATSTTGKNICPNNWELGEYNTTGEKGDSEDRIRIPYLVPCKPNTTYYANTYISDNTYDIKFILRCYDSSKTFIRNYSAINNGATFTTQENEYFISLTLYDVKSTTSDILNLVKTGVVKPFICLDSETDKTYTEFTPNSPSPDYPSRIRNVGDNINLAQPTTNLWFNGVTMKFSDNANTYGFVAKVIPNTDYIIHKKNKGNRFIIASASAYPQNNTDVVRNIFTSNHDLTEYTFKTKDNENYIFVGVYYGTNQEEINQAMAEFKIEEGSIPTPYTPYNCGSADFKITGKNKLKITSFVNRTTDGVTFTAKFDIKGNLEYINAVGNSTTGYRDIMRVDISNLPEGKYKINGLGTDKVIRYVLLKGNNAEPKIITTNTDVEFTQDSASPYLHFRIDLYMAGEVNATIKPMIRPSIITDNTYEPYQEQIKSFPFTEGQVIHKDDYIMNNESHQNRKTVIINGTENISYENNMILIKETGLNQKKYKNGGKCISNYFKYVSPNSGNGIWIGNETPIIIQDSKFTSATSFITWAKARYEEGTPLEIEYDLAEEIVTPLTKEQEQAYYELQHLLMYEGYTSIECIDEIKPDIQLTYWYNNELNKSYGERFDKVEENINELEKREIYSTEEQVIGSWIDNKPLYRKTIDVGNLPNATTKNISFNILNLKNIIKIEGYAKGPNYWLPIPYSNITVMCNSSVVGITTTIDRSNCTGFITLYYTKTTD